jgi:hypothetical protein
VQEQLKFTAKEDEPATFAEAELDQGWRTMMEEINSILDNHTWKLAELSRNHHAIGLKWVYKLKKDESGAVIKKKVRLIAKGYVQQAGIDFDEVFAPMVCMESVQLVLALATDEGWEIHNMDVKMALLNFMVYGKHRGCSMRS